MKRLLAAAAVVLLVASAQVVTAAPGSCFGRRPTIIGSAGNDVISGTPGPDVIAARGGDDKVYGNGGSDRICGGGGDDRLYGGDGADRIELGRPGYLESGWGGDGPDLLVGGGRHDNCDGIWELRGGGGDDRLLAAPDTSCVSMFGGFGDDELDTGEGGGSLIGGPGDDVMTGSGFFEGGAGDDVMRGGLTSRVVFDDPAGVRVDLARGTAVGPGEGRDTITGIGSVVSTDGDDVVIGDDGANHIVGGDGDDRLLGAGGADTIEGRAGDDEVDGGTGNDYVMAAPGNDRVGGGADDDVLTNEYSLDRSREPAGTDYEGGAGRDRLHLKLHPAGSKPVAIDLAGTSSVDGAPLVIVAIEDVTVYGNARVELYGDEGPNTLRASGPEALIHGRGGDDVFGLDAESSAIDGGAGADAIDAAGPWPITVDLASGTYSEHHGSGTVGGIEILLGSWGDDVLRGDDGPNVIRASLGNDVAEGRGGDDFLEGLVGDDRLDGGDGTDSIDGGDGTDECVNGEMLASCE